MGMLALAFAALGFTLYVRSVPVEDALALWQKVLDNHPSKREEARRHIRVLVRTRRILGSLLAVQSLVVVALLWALLGKVTS